MQIANLGQNENLNLSGEFRASDCRPWRIFFQRSSNLQLAIPNLQFAIPNLQFLLVRPWPNLTCIVVTPEQTVRETQADFVALTLFDGEIGIAPGHTPLIGRLGCGEMRIRRGQAVERLYVEGGFVEVVDNVVSLLANRAIPAEKIDEEAANRMMDAARSKAAHTPELMAARERALAQGRAQLRVAQRAVP